jgi:hypothetical protein
MTSSTDFQKLWFLYKTEGSPNGISINDFCLNRGVSYSEFEKWYGGENHYPALGFEKIENAMTAQYVPDVEHYKKKNVIFKRRKDDNC